MWSHAKNAMRFRFSFEDHSHKWRAASSLGPFVLSAGRPRPDHRLVYYRRIVRLEFQRRMCNTKIEGIVHEALVGLSLLLHIHQISNIVSSLTRKPLCWEDAPCSRGCSSAGSTSSDIRERSGWGQVFKVGTVLCGKAGRARGFARLFVKSLLGTNRSVCGVEEAAG